MLQAYANLFSDIFARWCPSYAPGGFTLLDQGRESNHLSLVGITSTANWLTAPGGTSIYFGSGTYAEGLSNKSFLTDITVAFWLNPDAAALTNPVTFFCTKEGVSSGWASSFPTLYLSSGALAATRGNGTSTEAGVSLAAGNLVANTWQHVTAVFRGSFCAIYINGVEKATATRTFNLADNTTVLRLGNRAFPSNTPAYSKIDDFIVWKRALTIPEIKIIASERRIGLNRFRQRRADVVSGDQTINANLYTNTSTIYLPTVVSGQTINANLFTNTNTFYNATITRGAVNIAPNLLTNTNTFYNATVTQGFVISPNLFTNTNTFYNATVTRGAVNIAAQLLTNTSTIYQPTVARADATIFPNRLNNTSVVYSPTITGGTPGVQDTSDILSRGLSRKKRKKSQEEIDEENVAAQILKARQGKKVQYQEPKKQIELNLKDKLEANQPIESIVEEVARTVEPETPFTDDMRNEISAILATYQLKLKQQRRAKQLQVLMLLATMDD